MSRPQPAAADPRCHTLLDGNRQFVWEPDVSMFGSRARMTVYEDDGTGGWKNVMSPTFSTVDVDGLIDYLIGLRAHLKGQS